MVEWFRAILKGKQCQQPTFTDSARSIGCFDRFERWLLLMPIVLWFSYQPNIYLMRTDSMNVELSLPIIYLTITAFVGLPRIWSQRRALIALRAVWLIAIFVAWNGVSVLWSANPMRTILTTGVWGVLFIDFLAMLSVRRWQKLLPIFMQMLLFSAVIMSLIAILQVAYGAWTDWGLCHGCVAAGFGFVRPSGFAIEPQFFGSLLIAPILILFQKVFTGKNISKVYFAALAALLMALYLTLSRGAIAALVIGVCVLIILMCWRRQVSWKYAIGFTTTIVTVSFGLGMVWHGVFTQLNPRVTDNWYDSMAKSAHQLTLGYISLPRSQPQPSELASTPAQPQKALFDGYVERSTDERTQLNDLALKTWRKDFPATLIGVGAGGAGRKIFEYTKKTGQPAEIVQNEFISLLVELGLVGLGLWLVSIFGLFQKIRHQAGLLAVLVAYLVQWNFFSGLPNALHIYCTLMLMFVIINGVYAKTKCINRRVHARQPGAPSYTRSAGPTTHPAGR